MPSNRMRDQLMAPVFILMFIMTPIAKATHVTDRFEKWTPRVARLACIDLANVAVRRASKVTVVFTVPARFRANAWTLRGVVRLEGAPGGLALAPFTCWFTQTSDGFEIVPTSLTLGP